MDKNERLENGEIQVQAIIEMGGKPKEHVEKTLKDYVEKIKKEKHIEVIDEEFEDPEEKDNMFTAFADLTFWIKDINQLIGFCFDYMPSSVEIVEPESLKMESKSLTDLFNDLQARLHQVEMISKRLYNDNNTYAKSVNTLARNLIKVSLSKNPMDKSSLARLTGIKEDHLQKFIDKMKEEDKIKEENGKFSLK